MIHRLCDKHKTVFLVSHIFDVNKNMLFFFSAESIHKLRALIIGGGSPGPSHRLAGGNHDAVEVTFVVVGVEVEESHVSESTVDKYFSPLAAFLDTGHITRGRFKVFWGRNLLSLSGYSTI